MRCWRATKLGTPFLPIATISPSKTTRCPARMVPQAGKLRVGFGDVAVVATQHPEIVALVAEGQNDHGLRAYQAHELRDFSVVVQFGERGGQAGGWHADMAS